MVSFPPHCLVLLHLPSFIFYNTSKAYLHRQQQMEVPRCGWGWKHSSPNPREMRVCAHACCAKYFMMLRDVPSHMPQAACSAALHPVSHFQADHRLNCNSFWLCFQPMPMPVPVLHIILPGRACYTGRPLPSESSGTRTHASKARAVMKKGGGTRRRAPTGQPRQAQMPAAAGAAAITSALGSRCQLAPPPGRPPTGGSLPPAPHEAGGSQPAGQRRQPLLPSWLAGRQGQLSGSSGTPAGWPGPQSPRRSR